MMCAKSLSIVGLSLVLSLASTACSPRRLAPLPAGQGSQPSVRVAQDGLASTERLITILATNDIHGGVEPGTAKDGSPLGGMSVLAGTARAIRDGLNRQYGPNAGTLLLDGGDQFQGTLISNYNEGQLVFETMNEAGYDAIIPGNHDYDFGPTGWLDDQVNASNPDKDPRGALRKLVKIAHFPLLSANTFFKASIVSATTGKPLAVDGNGCKSSSAIDWSKAQRPDFLTPYVIKTVAGVRVALIGLDHPQTPDVTTASNVSDLCFADLVETYQRVHDEIGSGADVFVVIMHYGDSNTQFDASNVIKKIAALPGRPVDAVVAGHTHFVNNVLINGVPMIQSGANGQMFGRIDLVYDVAKKALVPAKMRKFAGVQLLHQKCAKETKDVFCADPAAGSQAPAIEGQPLALDANIDALIAQARSEVAPIASRVIGDADGPITVDRIAESPMGDSLTDALRAASGAEIAFMNTGGMRAPFKAGPVTYEDFFRVLPFNNHGVIIGPMAADSLIKVLSRSIQSCGAYGALMESGLKVGYEKNCDGVTTGIDNQGRLLHVETLGGEVIFDAASGVQPAAGKVFRVATLDFLANGGDHFDGLAGLPLINDMGIEREVLTDLFLKTPMHFSSKVDGRLTETKRP